MAAKPSNDNVQLKARILVIAREKFLQFGFTSVTTEELASDLGISKKTLYVHYQSKEELLREAVLGMLDEVELQLKGILLDSEIEFSEKLSRALSLVRDRFSRVSQPFAHDIARSAPNIWREFETYRQKKIFRQFAKLFSSGVSKGLIRKDINYDLIVLIFDKLVDSVMNPEVVSGIPYSTDEVFDHMMSVFLAGILTDKVRSELLGRPPHSSYREE
jgi:AcrR family transcriptional regulator